MKRFERKADRYFFFRSPVDGGWIGSIFGLIFQEIFLFWKKSEQFEAISMPNNFNYSIHLFQLNMKYTEGFLNTILHRFWWLIKYTKNSFSVRVLMKKKPPQWTNKYSWPSHWCLDHIWVNQYGILMYIPLTFETLPWWSYYMQLACEILKKHSD